MLQAMMALDATKFTGPMQQATGATGGLLGSLKGMLGPLAGLAAGFLSVKAVIGGMKGAISMGAELDHQSKQTGVAVDQLVVMRQALDDVGIGAGQTSQLIGQMHRAMQQTDKQGRSTNAGFKALGINMAQFRTLGAEDQFKAIGQAVNGLGSQSEKSAALMHIFGRSGTEMLKLFEGGDAFSAARESLGSMPDMMARNAAAFENFDTLVGRAKGKFTGLWAGILESAMPALNQIMAYVDKIDFAKWGQAIGTAFRTGLALFQSGQFGDVIRLSLGIAFGAAVNALIGPLMNGSTWKGIGQIILAGFMGIGAGLIKIFAEPINYLQAGMDKVMDLLFAGLGKIPGLGKALGLDGYQAKSFEEHLADRRANGTFISRAGDESAAMAREMAAAGMRNIGQGIAERRDVTGTGAMREELAGIWDAARDSLAEAAPQLGAAVAQAMPAIEAKGAPAAKQTAESADRLAKIGLFVGAGSQNAAQTRLAERTARATERMGALLKQLVDKDAAAPVAVWA